MSISFPKNLFLIVITLLLSTNNSFAWSGYDRVNNTEVEIGAGNLVREGEIIKFYDSEQEEDRKAEVRSVEDYFSGSRVEVYDFIDQKIRSFDMEY